MNSLVTGLVTARRVAVVAFAVGGAVAAFELALAEHVLEFQAGPPSPLGERLLAWSLRVGYETLGWAAVGLALALVATALSAIGRGDAAARRDRARGLFALLVGSLAVMITLGGMYGLEFLPFLYPLELALYDLVGVTTAFTAGVVLAALSGWLTGRAGAGAPRTRAALGTGAAIALGLASWAIEFVRVHGPPGPAPKLALAAGIALLAVPVAALLARALQPAVDAVVRRLDAGAGRFPIGNAAVLAAAALLAGGWIASAPADDVPPAPTLVAADPAAGARPNVVYVVVDTLRADALSCYGYPRPTSPNLDAIAAQGTRFADFSAAAPWTKPSTATLLTGLYPGRHGALFHGASMRVPPGERALADVFQEAGYQTAGFVTNPNVKRVFGFDRGFDHFFDSPVEDTPRRAAIRSASIGALISALTRHQFNWKYENDVRALNSQVVRWLDGRGDAPFFLYLHYIDPHSPYSPPAEFRRLFAEDHGMVLHNERKRLVGRDLYDGEVRYADTGLGELIDELRARGEWDNTLFVLTSDHGEEWFEFGALGHGYSLYQPVVGVPLIVHGPGVAAGRVVDEPLQMVDLPATVCDLAGLGVERLGDGESFAAAASADDWAGRELVFLENQFGMGQHDNDDFIHTGLRQGRWKLIHTEKSKFRPAKRGYPTEELFDLEADPLERNNLYDDPRYTDLIMDLEGLLAAHLQFLEDEGLRGLELDGEMDAATAEQLRALGYMGD